MILYHVYDAFGGDRDFLLGWVLVMREVVDLMVEAIAIKESAMRRFAEISSTSDWDVEARSATSLVNWILSELRVILDQSG